MSITKDPLLPSEVSARILAGARRHFFQHGFRSVTMSELASELGMSKKTLYVHFAGKDQLVAAVLDAKFAELSAALEGISSGSEDFDTTLHGLLTAIQEQAGEISPSFPRDLIREAPEVFATFREKRQALIARTFGRLLRKGQKEGAVRRDIPVDFQIEVLLAAVRGVATPEKVAETNLGPGKLIQQILSIFLQGILTTEARTNL